jgi:DNA polymerase V
MLALPSERAIALIDGNNFYVSCERVFNPKLITQPLVILSNNDGCIVSRSDEAKQLGISMAVPYFQAKELIEKNKVHAFSDSFFFCFFFLLLLLIILYQFLISLIFFLFFSL